MKIVIGLDHGAGSDALVLLKRLRFREAHLNLTHVIEPLSWAPAGVYAGGFPTEAALAYGDVQAIQQQQIEDAGKMLSSASGCFDADEGDCTTFIAHGNPTELLLEHADTTHADLLAVSAAQEGPLLALLTGSVARGIASGAKQSVLLARGGSPDSDGDAAKPVRAVLATDHSPYMDRCIERFVRFRPQGLEHLTVLTAYPETNLKELREYMPHLAINPADAVRHELEERNRTLVRRLQDAFHPDPITITSEVSGESVDHAIKSAMRNADADLLIVGAHGHSFLARLTLGSVSFRQAMASPYSVLMLRVDGEEAAAIRSARRAESSLPPTAVPA